MVCFRESGRKYHVAVSHIWVYVHEEITIRRWKRIKFTLRTAGFSPADRGSGP